MVVRCRLHQYGSLQQLLSVDRGNSTPPKFAVNSIFLQQKCWGIVRWKRTFSTIHTYCFQILKYEGLFCIKVTETSQIAMSSISGEVGFSTGALCEMRKVNRPRNQSPPATSKISLRVCSRTPEIGCGRNHNLRPDPLSLVCPKIPLLQNLPPTHPQTLRRNGLCDLSNCLHPREAAYSPLSRGV